MHGNFNHVNKIEARDKVLDLIVNFIEVHFYAYVRHSWIASILFAYVNFTHVHMYKLRNSGNPPSGRTILLITYFIQHGLFVYTMVHSSEFTSTSSLLWFL